MRNKRRTGGRPRETVRGARGADRLPLFFSYLSYLLLSQVLHSTETPGDQAESGQQSHQTTGVLQVLDVSVQGLRSVEINVSLRYLGTCMNYSLISPRLPTPWPAPTTSDLSSLTPSLLSWRASRRSLTSSWGDALRLARYVSANCKPDCR